MLYALHDAYTDIVAAAGSFLIFLASRLVMRFATDDAGLRWSVALFPGLRYGPTAALFASSIAAGNALDTRGSHLSRLSQLPHHPEVTRAVRCCHRWATVLHGDDACSA